MKNCIHSVSTGIQHGFTVYIGQHANYRGSPNKILKNIKVTYKYMEVHMYNVFQKQINMRKELNESSRLQDELLLILLYWFTNILLIIFVIIFESPLKFRNSYCQNNIPPARITMLIFPTKTSLHVPVAQHCLGWGEVTVTKMISKSSI